MEFNFVVLRNHRVLFTMVMEKKLRWYILAIFLDLMKEKSKISYCDKLIILRSNQVIQKANLHEILMRTS